MKHAGKKDNFKYILKQIHVYNKKGIISEATLTITTNLKNSYKLKSNLLVHIMYHLVNIKIEAL